MKASFVAGIILLTIGLSLGMQAQIPREVSYQGLLSDSAGNFKPDGPYSITFRLYSSAISGSILWVETKTLQVKRGLFYTILGDVTAFPASVKFDQQYWLSIQVSGEAELAKRLQFTPVPYSLTSIMSDTARYALSAPRQTYTDTAGVVLTIPINSVDSEKITDGSISTNDIRDQSITSAKIDTSGLRVSAVIPDNSITGQTIAPNQVVRSINGLHDLITLTAQGGATLSSNGDTLIINAGSGGGGTGIQGVQNTNNTLDILNPNGPTTTINVKTLGITAAYIADGAIDSNKLGSSSVTTLKLTDGSVTQSKIATGVTLPPGGTAGGDLTGTYPNPSLANNAIGTLNIRDGTILRADVDPNFKAPGADSADYVRNPPTIVDSARIAGTVPDNTITNAKILDGTIQRADVVSNFKAPYADTADYVRNPPTIADSARIAGTVPDNTIVNTKILNGTITSAKLAFTPGTVTNIITGSGLTGGPISTSGTISIPTNGVTNGMLQSSSLSINPGPGLSGGGTVSLGGTTSLRMPLSGAAPGTYDHATIRVDSLGRVESAVSSPINLGTADVAGTLTVGHGGTGTASSLSAGSVVFADTAGVYSQDNTNFFWDNSSDRLGIGVTNPNSRLHVNGSMSTGLVTAAADLTLGDFHSIVLCNGPAGTPLNINLPSAVGIAGRQYTLKNIAANSPVNIKPFNTETIDGSGGYALSVQFMYVVLISNGADWFVTGNN